ncbi:hypothetical protein GA0074695_4005 [Micromonospora viridifaciens]|uniref:DUF11 domain-containing protein n=1 Tax=Micromonospora viridifaciens TaxID=1881 RepID=A0A1C4YA08_MICVI|nr:hypothetical protein [Micromonospora viridifaciens]SCF17573.1 hypothetical protein GA0074695_4005 [Micromonospora viridifaciens]
MWESVAAPMVGLMAAVAGVAPTPTPSPAVTFAPVLTSAPFGALPGQRVTHTVTISGTGVLTATRVTFTTTADLDDVTVQAEPGECTTSPRTVVCDLGDLSLGSTAGAPRITISGRVRPGAPPGTVVRNRVSVTSVESAAAGAPVASNAYLIPGPTHPPTDPPLESSPQAAGGPPPGSALPAVVAMVLAAAAAVGTLLLTRRRRRHQPPTRRM